MRISEWSSDVCSSDLFAAGIYGRRKTNIQPYQSVIVSMHEPRDQTEQRLAMQNRSSETHFLRLPRIDMQGIAITEIAVKVGQVLRDSNLLALRLLLPVPLPLCRQSYVWGQGFA